MQTVIVNGLPRSGKDTFVDACIDHLAALGANGFKVSSVDAVKQAAQILGWDGEKDACGRQFLSDLKDLSTRAYDGPLRFMRSEIARVGADVSFVFIREPDEIRKFIATFPDTVTVLVTRPDAEQFDNHADRNVGNYTYDYIVSNSTTVKALANLAGIFVDFLARKKGAAA